MLNPFFGRSFFLWMLLLVVVLSVVGCAKDTYRSTIPDVRKAIAQQQYTDAITLISRNNDYNRPCNKLLYNLEMGKLYHASGDYVKSNQCLNEADQYFDDWHHLRIRDIQGNYKLGGNDERTTGHLSSFNFFGLSNTDYRPEDYEKILIHYYKAMNYLCLKQTDEALVEARRLDLLLNNLSVKDYFTDHSKILADPFTQILIGLIYESGNNMNAAFTAYRNAGKMYKYEKDMPDFLKHQILRTSYLTGLDYETGLYENLFGMRADSITSLYARSVVILWENGMAPLKEVEYVIVSSSGFKQTAPPFYTVEEESRGNFLADLLFGYRKVNKPIPGKLIAIPKYVSTPSYYQSCKIAMSDSRSFNREPLIIEDLESLTTGYINERSMSEVDLYGSGAPDTTQISSGVSPDLRNWHSLPARISYCRVPLHSSDSVVSLLFFNNKNEADTLHIAVNPNQKFMVKNVITYK